MRGMRLFSRLSVLLTGSLSLCASAAAVDDAQQLRTFECIAAFGGATESADASVARDAAYGQYFFIGRIDPALNEAEMAELGRRAAAGVTASNIQAIFDSCVAEVERTNDVFNGAMRRLQESGVAR